jgi:hypothetical protein
MKDSSFPPPCSVEARTLFCKLPDRRLPHYGGVSHCAWRSGDVGVRDLADRTPINSVIAIAAAKPWRRLPKNATERFVLEWLWGPTA